MTETSKLQLVQKGILRLKVNVIQDEFEENSRSDLIRFLSDTKQGEGFTQQTSEFTVSELEAARIQLKNITELQRYYNRQKNLLSKVSKRIRQIYSL